MSYKTFSFASGETIHLMDYPLECPECHQKTTPNYQSHRVVKDNNRIFAFLSCPNPQCDQSYVAEYDRRGSSTFYYRRIIKGKPKSELFPPEIETLSPSFIKIYNEAFMAEQLELLEISGVGYRKALEFLIKDYLIQHYPTKEDNIKGMFLGKCINEMVEDTKIKETSKRAVWLGNDQTHYVKKWEDKDLVDLKKLIKLTVNWVESEIITQDLTNSMPE